MKFGASFTAKKSICATTTGKIGDQYTFVAIDRAPRLVLSYLIGKRTAVNAQRLLDDLAKRIAGRPQIKSDGFKAYIDAVEWAFGAHVDFAQLVKMMYAGDEAGRERYSCCCASEVIFA